MTLLDSKGVSTASLFPLPLPGTSGCIGTRADISGTPAEAACILAILGPTYVVDPVGCNGDGFPHTVIVK